MMDELRQVEAMISLSESGLTSSDKPLPPPETTIPSILPRAFLLLDSHLVVTGFAMTQVAQGALISLDGLQNI
ncbi:hypothetical protein ARMGADRAFT_272924 [Armillaria gallica]|uniref:Uncharacterized protein n=1 Tax=Armillaria gallica TaxID=47427 RepID=A0A2H3E8Z7_ARMGA|nr:hypothetical protein ARMGADRAFT_272924 [Armillaria gallica]